VAITKENLPAELLFILFFIIQLNYW